MRRLFPLALLLLCSCYKTDIVSLSDSGSPGKVERVWTHAVLWGLVPITQADVKQRCGDKGAWAISTRMNGWQAILGGLTGGIYTPMTAKITCKG